MFEDLLSIVVITYNRALILQRTLRNLMSSPLNGVQITVLNNCSSDNTVEICEEFSRFPNFKVVTHKFNIGGDANIMRAYEYADAPYVWIMGDDDIYDFSDIDDLEEALRSGKYDVLQLGSTVYESDWKYAGRGDSIKTLMNEGYNYFRLSSNVSCSIVRTADVRKNAIAAYQNIVNHYPHMPLLLQLYERDAQLYITKKSILKIVIGSENYSHYDFIKWWTDTSVLLKKKSDRTRFVMSQFPEGRSKVLAGCYLSYIKKGRPSIHTISLLCRAMPWKNKIGSFFIVPFRYFEIKRDIKKAAGKIKT